MFEPTTLPTAIDPASGPPRSDVADAHRQFGCAGAERDHGEADHDARHPGAGGEAGGATDECLGAAHQSGEPGDQECNRADAHGGWRL